MTRVQCVTLDEFLAGDARNAWISFIVDNVVLEAYVRKTYRCINGQEGLQRCFDVANISVLEKNRGQRVFTKFWRTKWL